ncbi:hypothetical protein GCM10011494_29960 [Novosphingobium endophyticum]|uniref:Uncharacterized protein n=1 Tax=Novosphingobium endophyticum TaxID=1955250 RepID=A0A916X6I4_9SPHN|nr:hypothetical protein GCM10011494_29960 [Novosphingobium endophyticum]
MQGFVVPQEGDDESAKRLPPRSTLQAYARIEIPTYKDDLTFRTLQSSFQICKILLTVYNG